MKRPNTMRPDLGQAELTDVRRRSTGLLIMVFIFSMVVNALMLTGPIYMLQVYDRVLGSRSEETLLALSVLVTFLFLMMGIMDHIRGRVMARVGARFQSALDGRVFQAHLRRAAATPGGAGQRNPLRDVEAVQRLLSSPVFLALFDIPWTPLFLGAIFVFHPWLGILACSGGLVLIVLAGVNQWMTSGPMAVSNQATARAELTAQQLASEAELVQSLGMRDAAFQRWMTARGKSLQNAVSYSDRSGFFTVTTKTLRLFLQSAMLGLGAYLVLQNQLTAGAMIAGSILMGRALAPIEMVIGQWQLVHGARKGRSGVIELLETVPPTPERTPLPRPQARLTAENVTIVPPGAQQASLRGVSFMLQPGQAMGVIGPSGAGKTSLAKAICGVWMPAGGKMRLDSATLDQYDPDVLGGYIGYLPQTVTLFDGTIADNIGRLAPNPDPEKIVEAAQKAAAHEMILEQPAGYDTPVSAVGGRLSGGQIQRIGLARAMYGDPVVLVLDEPNSNLDNEGTIALNKAIRGMKDEGKSVIIIAHRPAAIQECDVLLMLSQGMRTAFGPREEVLQKMVKNHSEITRSPEPGGVS
ncbi:protease/lipase ABC transporter permease/ATP-binding protein [Jannaschia pagri]|uniref:Protease/lipase ABC transporter permease/ATP-binding protein n=1 Tax=Jannaschia pagri TaxID=2829797 RepID=A0ABQ4NQ83_9RHOB|nr:MULTISPECIES: type I secretion system permease/ATPase [unclassified Jannaschia]GIT92563.1 protease/lipase ABC transporter permease/ATP-binding protein [Jannaschia sp. AI_61]GIT96577.1 protease/lipase ABC transporter permease/ATP-binding protein [Jannaschia sp. AI_62]